jgi:hypothetical protein
MSYRHNEEWRMRVVLALAWQEVQPVEKVSEEGERFSCLVHHLHGDGLIQISRQASDSGNQIIYRLDRSGGLKGVFACYVDGQDELIYDRMSGFGNHHQAEVDCSTMLGRLEVLMQDDEIEGIYL